MKKNLVPISICLAAYNGEQYIREAIDSVLAQTLGEFELIISDDGSSDGTEAICREYASKDPRVLYIRHNVNRGGFWNNNFLLSVCQGEYTTFLSQDDVMLPSFLETTYKYAVIHNQCILIACDIELIDKDGQTTGIAYLDKIREYTPWHVRMHEFFRDPRSHVAMCLYGLFKSSHLKSIYDTMPWPKTLVKASEVPLLCRIAVTGEVVSIPTVLRKYRRHDQSAYHREMNMLRSKPEILRRFILLKHSYKLRFDQFKVLIGSSCSWPRKLSILTKAYGSYLLIFLDRLVKLPKKFT
jgi:glycosyltransferase involved in cell wall biosynthesis